MELSSKIFSHCVSEAPTRDISPKFSLQNKDSSRDEKEREGSQQVPHNWASEVHPLHQG